MRKIFCFFFIIFIYNFHIQDIFAESSIHIISREEWGADEKIRYTDSQEWEIILIEENKKRIANGTYISNEDTILTIGTPEHNEKIEKYLNIFFSEQKKISRVISQENGKKLFWPIAQAEKIQGIVIHHTALDYANSYEYVRNIYRYHTLEKKWGDIGYNFLISLDGEIFEGRAGGEKAVGAHNKWNNIGNIGIGLIGNYSEKNIPQKQLDALNNLSRYLIEKYNIDLNKKVYFHEQCKSATCNKEIVSQLHSPIIAHRDSSDTTCPGNVGYLDFLELRQKLQKNYYKPDITGLKLETIFEKQSQKNLEKLLHALVVLHHKEENYKKKILFQEIISILKDYLHKKYV